MPSEGIPHYLRQGIAFCILLVLKRRFDKYRDEGELPPELSALIGMRLYNKPEHIKAWRNTPHGLHWVDGEGNLFHGAVDELLDNSGTLVVLDFKTRGFPLKGDSTYYYQSQLDIYNLLIRNNGVPTEDFSYLLILHPTGIEAGRELEQRVTFQTDLVNMPISVGHAEELFTHAREILKGPMPQAAEKCRYCQYVANAPRA